MGSSFTILLYDIAEQHPLFSMSQKFADHSSFTVKERARVLAVDVVLSTWVNFAVTWALTTAGYANGFPAPLCTIVRMPGWSIDWPNLPDEWPEVMLHEPELVTLVILVVSLIAKPVADIFLGRVFLAYTLEQEAFGHVIQQTIATGIAYFWMSMAGVYVALGFIGALRIHPPRLDNCVYDDGCSGVDWQSGNVGNSSCDRWADVSKLAYISSWDLDSGRAGACQTTFYNLTSLPAADDISTCYRPATHVCMASREANGDTCRDPASFFTSSFVSPLWLVLVDWLVGNPMLYIILRGLGIIKKPTSPMMSLGEVKGSLIQGPYVKLGTGGALFAHELAESQVLGVVRGLLYVCTLGAAWVAANIIYFLRSLDCCPAFVKPTRPIMTGMSWLQANETIEHTDAAQSKRDFEGAPLPRVSFRIVIRNRSLLLMQGLTLRYRIARAVEEDEFSPPLTEKLPSEEVLIEGVQKLDNIVLPPSTTDEVCEISFVPPRQHVEDRVGDDTDVRVKGEHSEGYHWFRLQAAVFDGSTLVGGDDFTGEHSAAEAAVEAAKGALASALKSRADKSEIKAAEKAVKVAEENLGRLTDEMQKSPRSQLAEAKPLCGNAWDPFLLVVPRANYFSSDGTGYVTKMRIERNRDRNAKAIDDLKQRIEAGEEAPKKKGVPLQAQLEHKQAVLAELEAHLTEIEELMAARVAKEQEILIAKAKVEQAKLDHEHIKHDHEQLHVRHIGVQGWDGTEDGVGTYENEEALRALFSPFGEVVTAVIRHRVDKIAQENTSYALVTMGDEASCERVLAAGVTAGATSLLITKFDQQTASSSKGGMAKLLEEAEARLRELEESHDVEVFAGDLLQWPDEVSSFVCNPNPRLLVMAPPPNSHDSGFEVDEKVKFANPLDEEGATFDSK